MRVDQTGVLTTEGVSGRFGDGVVGRRPTERSPPPLEPVKTLPALLRLLTPVQRSARGFEEAGKDLLWKLL